MVTAINNTTTLRNLISAADELNHVKSVGALASVLAVTNEKNEIRELKADIRNIYIGRDNQLHVSKSGFAAGEGTFGWLGRIIYGTKTTGLDALKQGLNSIFDDKNLVESTCRRIEAGSGNHTNLTGLMAQEAINRDIGVQAAEAHLDVEALANTKNESADEGLQKLKGFVSKHREFVMAFALDVKGKINQSAKESALKNSKHEDFVPSFDPRLNFANKLIQLLDEPESFTLQDFKSLHNNPTNHEHWTLTDGMERSMKSYIAEMTASMRDDLTGNVIEMSKPSGKSQDGHLPGLFHY